MSKKSEKDLPEIDKIGRRTVLKGTATVLGGGVIGAIFPSFSPAIKKTKPHHQESVADEGSTVVASADEAVVTTLAGKVAGYIRKGIFTFKGIPYGDTTGETNRFMPPVKPKPWVGTRSSRQYGSIAPQSVRNGSGNNDEEAFMFSWDDAVTRVYSAGEGEDCLRLNIWTPS